MVIQAKFAAVLQGSMESVCVCVCVCETLRAVITTSAYVARYCAWSRTPAAFHTMLLCSQASCDGISVADYAPPGAAVPHIHYNRASEWNGVIHFTTRWVPAGARQCNAIPESYIPSTITDTMYVLLRSTVPMMAMFESAKRKAERRSGYSRPGPAMMATNPTGTVGARMTMLVKVAK
ncbi:hypothetical protein LX36DRAFT_241837 [Colletotrichum falcatum]|nr:hypothetical protein LX36DRAFT_241837 [Colletotrichum falcatum]